MQRTSFLVLRGLAVAALLALAPAGHAQEWDSGGRGGFNERDSVTGYLCVTPGCDVLRLPNADCICTKDNPAEMKLSKLKLTCSTKRDGAWVACPVKPRYGK